MKNSINQILVFRQNLNPTNVTGQLYLNGEYIGYTLEDTPRPLNMKVKHYTAIPDSTYYAKLVTSPTFGRSLWLQDVANFTEILVHAGNDERNTSGCILLGSKRNPERDRIYDCKPALDKLLDKLDLSKPVVITVSNAIGLI